MFVAANFTIRSGPDKVSSVTNKSVVWFYFRPALRMGGRFYGRRGQLLHKVSSLQTYTAAVSVTATCALLEVAVQLNMAPGSNSLRLAGIMTAGTVRI